MPETKYFFNIYIWLEI